MNVSLTPELDRFVAEKVASGRYTSTSEVVREALRLLEEHDRSRAERLAEFNRELKRRLDSLDRGNFVEPEVVWAELERRSRERKKQRA
jgi:antitoxin ParD1/3/4